MIQAKEVLREKYVTPHVLDITCNMDGNNGNENKKLIMITALSQPHSGGVLSNSG